MCSLATEQWVLCWEPRVGTAAASIFKLSPSSCCRTLAALAWPLSLAASPCSWISSFFFPVISRDLRFWLKLPPARALLGKKPICRGGTPRGCCADEGTGGWVGSEPEGSGQTPGALRERRGFEIRYGISCRQTALRARATQSQGAGEEFHIAVGPSEISSSLCSIISRRMEYLERRMTRKEGFLQHQAGLLTQIAKKTQE